MIEMVVEVAQLPALPDSLPQSPLPSISPVRAEPRPQIKTHTDDDNDSTSKTRSWIRRLAGEIAGDLRVFTPRGGGEGGGERRRTIAWERM